MIPQSLKKALSETVNVPANCTEFLMTLNILFYVNYNSIRKQSE